MYHIWVNVILFFDLQMATQATLGVEVGKGDKDAGVKRCVLQCSVENKDPVFLCVLVSEQSETCHLELEFEEEVTFSVIGLRSIHLAGYYMTYPLLS